MSPTHGLPRAVGLIASVVLILGLSGCAPAPEPPWQRVSLLRLDPVVQGTGSTAPPRQELQLLGKGLRRARAEEVRIAGEVRVLDFQVGPEMQWTLSLGKDPYLSWIPLTRRRREGCALSYRTRVRAGGEGWKTLDERPAPEYETFAPAAVLLSLAEYAEQEVELGLKAGVRGEGCGGMRAQWGNPAVFSRAFPQEKRARSSAGQAAKGPNILFLGLDTLRADALGAYGRAPSPSPAIDRLAAESDVWLEAFTAFNITNPSFSSIHTGLYGKNHGVYDLTTPLPESQTTLAEHFSAAGWKTGGVVSARHLEGERSGLDQGFDELISAGKQLAAEDAVDRAIQWISVHLAQNARAVDEESADEEGAAPFFFWLHLFDPHTPHTAPEPFASGLHSPSPRLGPIDDWSLFRDAGTPEYRERRLGGHEALYESEVAYLDHHLGRLFDFLESHGLMENTIIALTADHGENLNEYGVEFRHSGLWDTVTHVPLLIRPAGGGEGRTFSGLAHSFDLFPTLLGLAGLPVPEQDGVDLYADSPRRVVFIENAMGNGAGVRTADHLYFSTEEERGGLAAGRFFYDLREDPQQLENLAGTGLPEEERLRDLLARWSADRRLQEDLAGAELNAEELEQLRALGYLD